MEQTLSRPRLISLAAGFTDNETLPVAETRRLLAELLSTRQTGEPALQYGSTPGLPVLRERTAARVLAQDRAAVGHEAPEALYRPEAVIITQGSQQLLYLVTEVLCDPGDVVIVEAPTYFVYLGILQCRGAQCRGVRLLPDGPDPVHLDRVLERLRRDGLLGRLKLAYLVTYHQNPTATTAAFERKAEVLERLRWAERAAGHPIYLLEDAAYRELGFHGPGPASALAAPGGSERVIYAGTYSKPFATGVRVGFGLAPEPVRTAVLRVKGNHDFGTASLGQHLLACALDSGVYDRHLTRLRARYAAKAGWMLEALKRHFPAGVTWREPRGGMYVWAQLPRGTRTGPRSDLFRRALAADVLYVPGRLCYGPDPTRRAPEWEMRLSFGNATEREIREGIRRLGQVLKQAI